MIDVDAVRSKCLSDVQQLSGMQRVVSEHDAGNQLEEVHVGRDRRCRALDAEVIQTSG